MFTVSWGCTVSLGAISKNSWLVYTVCCNDLGVGKVEEYDF
jgi:hypothetical protein